MFRHKGELLYSIPETATLADTSEEKILGYIITNQIENRTVFGTKYVTETGISDLLSWYGSTYHPDIAKDILNERPTLPLKPAQETLEYEGGIYHSVSHASRISGYAQKSIRQYLRSGVIPGQKIAGYWYVSDQGVGELRKRHLEFKPEPVKKQKRKPPQKGTKVEFNTPAARNTMKYVRRLSERLGMTIKDTCVMLMEMSLSNTEEISRMIRIAELKKVATHEKLQHYNNLIPEYTHESPVLLCSND